MALDGGQTLRPGGLLAESRLRAARSLT